MSAKLKLAVLVSGSGSNLQAIIDACARNNYPAEVSVVIANRPDAYGLERAKLAGIPAILVDHEEHKGRTAFEAALQDALDDFDIDLICLAGFMRILTADFIAKWPNKIINTHPALLPNFGGKGMYGEHVHTAVLAADEHESGCSIHYVIPEVDQGELIVQRRVDVHADDTVETLSARVIAQEHIAYPEAIEKIAQERLK